MATTHAFDDAIAFARDLIRIPSPSGGEEEVARRVRDEFEVLGYEEVWTDAWGNVVGVVRGRGK
ncbi:MAG: YgeY family selenium metabolism-linked hydrolase, partial [Gemmatimonadetes bacterium]|nr:YgeY family selenium metabolism-linked hydrolase [Gemmatimonadota bacterium]NIP81444.1 YgeY family selenium metabolism-linked hydrolase [Gemmatimonadota bacterium]NIR78198.1 YgeY family selenium metabolism-linked hydrolase [Gemmatimonadota bacterium]NIU30651.1 YgeY family selenium metabolism-linked hydrolase [Gemmatimonadota bacterium]NIU35457.1 YgeY family selenium metabolism-linked hydrolase [Gemmatimonadota bacterium]